MKWKGFGRRKRPGGNGAPLIGPYRAGVSSAALFQNATHLAPTGSREHERARTTTMGELSSQSSQQALLRPDDTCSLTIFPDPSTSSLEHHAQHESGGLNGLLDRSGPTLFDEQPSETGTDAHTLSSAPPEVLQNVIDYQGAASLVRRLATLLAERDAHITALTRLAEEYKVPQESIAATTSRVRQAEQRRLALTIAADEHLVPSASSENSVSQPPIIRIKPPYLQRFN